MDRIAHAIQQAHKDYQALKGGAGSGNFGHEGVPGHIGGSAPGGGHGGGSKADKLAAPHVSELKKKGKTTIVDGKRRATITRSMGGSGGFMAKFSKSSVTFHSSTEEGIVHNVLRHFRMID